MADQWIKHSYTTSDGKVLEISAMPPMEFRVGQCTVTVRLTSSDDSWHFYIHFNDDWLREVFGVYKEEDCISSLTQNQRFISEVIHDLLSTQKLSDLHLKDFWFKYQSPFAERIRYLNDNDKAWIRFIRDPEALAVENKLVRELVLKELYSLKSWRDTIHMHHILNACKHDEEAVRNAVKTLTSAGYLDNPTDSTGKITNYDLTLEGSLFVENNLLNPDKPTEETRIHNSGSEESEQYDVFLSFAGEQREYVRELAEILDQSDITYYFDENDEVRLWGKNMNEYFDILIQDRSEYLVMFISKEYKEKMWTTVERRSAIARAMREKREYILPCRFDDTIIKGLDLGAKYIDLRRKTPEELGKLIIDKIQQS